MDELREKRYNDKINFIVSSMKLIDKDLENELEKRGVYYSLQTSIESMIDLIAMIVKDVGIPVKDDENNILAVAKRYNIEQTLCDKLKKANGMRNILVHRYNTIEEELIFDSIDDLRTLLLKWVNLIEAILNDLTKNPTD